MSLVAEVLADGMALTGHWRNRDHYLPPLFGHSAPLPGEAPLLALFELL